MYSLNGNEEDFEEASNQRPYQKTIMLQDNVWNGSQVSQ